MATPAEGTAGRQLRRDVSPLEVMFVSLGSIIGSGWLFGALYASQMLLAVAQATNRSEMALEWRGASWLWPYLTGMAIVSYLGGFGEGAGVIPFGWVVFVVAVFSIAIYALAMSVRLTPEEVRRHVAEAREEAEEVDEELAGARKPSG